MSGDTCKPCVTSIQRKIHESTCMPMDMTANGNASKMGSHLVEEGRNKKERKRKKKRERKEKRKREREREGEKRKRKREKRKYAFRRSKLVGLRSIVRGLHSKR